MKFARIENGVVVELFDDDPRGRFHPALTFHEVTDDIRIGAPFVAPALLLTVSPVEFKLLFTPAERVAIQAARATDPVIEDFMAIVEDPRLTHVDLGLKSTREALAYLGAQGLITAERVQAILSGVLQ